jgi:hypothetical protein
MHSCVHRQFSSDLGLLHHRHSYIIAANLASSSIAPTYTSLISIAATLIIIRRLLAPRHPGTTFATYSIHAVTYTIDRCRS